MSRPAYVMVVDDDGALRDSICELLEEDGVRTVSAESGAAALSRLRAAPDRPDLILLDLMMPVMNGWQFREEQLRDPELSRIPVIVMTASRALQGIRADGVVYKPLKLQQLLEAVAPYVRREAGAEGAPSGPGASDPPRDRTEARDHPPRPAEGRADSALVLRDGGEMSRLVLAKDWAQTPLGPLDRWPRSLTAAVSLCLASRYQVIIFWSRDLIQIYNDAFLTILGKKHPLALGQSARECWAEMWASIAPLYEHVFTTGTATRSDNIHLPVQRHGYLEESFYTMSYTPVFDEEGGVGGVFNVILETTEQVVAERRTRTMRDLAARTADAKSDEDVCRTVAETLDENNSDVRFALIYLADGDQRLTLAASTTLGQDARSRAAAASVAAADSDAWGLFEVLSSTRPRIVEGLSKKLGVIGAGPWGHPVESAVVLPLSRPGQRPYGVLVAGVTPQRALDEGFLGFLSMVAGHVATAIGTARAYVEERARAEALAELDRAKTTFFSNISHEFRTPLTLMIGPTEDLLSGAHGAIAGDQREQIELIHRSALRLQKLVNALLDFSRIEAGRIQASYEPADLAALTRDLASAFQSAIERAGLSLDVDCPPLPEPAYVDRDMWEKIVLNLVSNALKFTFEGGITVSLRAEDGRFILRVADTGAGVPEAEIPRLFERFHRVEGARSRTHEGSGIGLALVQELVRLHGGTARVESRLGVGSTFTVAIPAGSGHLPQERVGAPQTAASTAFGAGAFVEEALRWSAGGSQDPPAHARGKSAAEPRASTSARRERVLVADDNADMRGYLRRMLEVHWAVELVEDGQRALEVARARPPDLVLTDVMMPGLDGFALLRELRRDSATRLIPVVMLSARAGEESRVEGLEAGADDYLIKPFSARELVARVRTHIELGRLRDEIRRQHAHLYELFVQFPVPICVFRGPELILEMANESMLKVLARRDVIGKRYLDIYPEIKGQGFDELLLRVMRTGESFSGEEMLATIDRRGDGRLEDTYWTLTYAPLRGPDGAVDRVVAAASEVTHQVLARREIERSEERFRRIVTQVQAGIAQTDLSGRFTLVNERFREIVGRSEAELRSLRMREILHPEDLGACLERFRRMVESGAPFVIEARYVRPEGSIVWAQNSVSRLDDAAGRPVAATVVSIDVTQRRLVERALRETAESERAARQEAERAARFSEMFIGILGHDLRSPLSAITTSAELLAARAGSDKIAKPAGRIVSSASRMERMISQLLDFTRIRLGRGLPLDLVRADLAEVSRVIIEELQLVHGREIQLEAAGDTAGTWDRDRLSQLLSNLLANACQHGTPGTPALLRLDGSRPYAVHIEVRNHGVIPADLLPVVFEPLRGAGEGRTRRRGSSGLGLGLYITQQVVLAHGGDIRVESNEERGTRFVVRLPRSPAGHGERVFPGGDAFSSGEH